MWLCGGCGHWTDDAAAHCPKCGSKAPRPTRASRRAGSRKVRSRKVRSRKVRSRRLLVALVLAVVVALGGLYGHRVLRGDSGNDPPPALDSYMHGGGVTFSFPGSSTSVRLPEDPKVETSTASVGAITVVISRAGVQRQTYEMAFSEYAADVLRRGDPATINQALEGGSNDAANAVGLSVGHTDDTPVDGRPARSVHGTVKGDQADLLMVYADGNIYALFVHTHTGSAAVLREFKGSLRSG